MPVISLVMSIAGLTDRHHLLLRDFSLVVPEIGAMDRYLVSRGGHVGYYRSRSVGRCDIMSRAMVRGALMTLFHS